MILIIDNYDSFVYTLAGYLQKLGHETKVYRNDHITIEEIKQLQPKAILLSPGPSKPINAGICIELIQAFGETTPILGICLGHQAIGEAYGGKTIKSKEPMHGKSEPIQHNGETIFDGIDNPVIGGRYHSLITSLPENSDLIISAYSQNNEIMAMYHKDYPVYGLQFHPESILTPKGLDLIKNFLHIAKSWNLKSA